MAIPENYLDKHNASKDKKSEWKGTDNAETSNKLDELEKQKEQQDGKEGSADALSKGATASSQI